jgi:transcriptional regulator with XRE-family HTH domain
MAEIQSMIGKSIKAVRAKNGMSLEDIAKQAGMSVDLLSHIEEQIANPTLEQLVRLAEVLGVTVGRLMGDTTGSSFCIVRRNAGAAVSRFTPADGRKDAHSYEGLGRKKEDRRMEPFIVTLAPDEVHRVEPSEHTGEEFIFVLRGQVKVTLHDHTDVLQAGDSIYFDSYLPHTVVCDGEEPATILAVLHEKHEMIIF